MRLLKGLLRALRLLPFALVLFAVLGAGCDHPQYIVIITTNAPVPAWGDRVLVEVLNANGSLACDECRHEFDTTVDTMPFSFGMPFPSDLNTTTLRVRGRLYRAHDVAPDGLPPKNAVIDAISDTPTGQQVPFQTTKLYLILQAYCYGCAADVALQTSCNVVDGEPGFVCGAPEQAMYDSALVSIDPFLPNEINQDSACKQAAPAGQVCMPGEAFILGDANAIGIDTDYPTTPTVPQFPGFPSRIDEDEMTVGRARPIIAKLGVGSLDILTHGAAGVPDACTYLGPKNAANDAMPLNCVSLALASVICDKLGLQLPTEEQWEAAAENGSSSYRFPWGDNPPDCTRAIVSADPSCIRKGPVAGGSPLDVTPRGIKNLGGNLSEWVADAFVPYGDPCWKGKDGLGADCVGPYIDWQGPWPHRGGSYARRASSAATFARFSSPRGDPDPEIGFRCATDYNQNY